MKPKTKIIKKTLKNKGLTQAKLARRLGVANSTMCALINGKCKSKRLALEIEQIIEKPGVFNY